MLKTRKSYNCSIYTKLGWQSIYWIQTIQTNYGLLGLEWLRCTTPWPPHQPKISRIWAWATSAGVLGWSYAFAFHICIYTMQHLAVVTPGSCRPNICCSLSASQHLKMSITPQKCVIKKHNSVRKQQNYTNLVQFEYILYKW